MHNKRTLMMTMKSSLSAVFLLLFSSSVSGLGSVVWSYYSYHELYYNWTEAQSYCRSHSIDLAFFYSQSDWHRTHFSNYHSVWVDLHKVNGVWTWTTNESHNISKLGPHNTDDTHTCAMYSFRHKKFFGRSCEESYFVLCQKRDRSKYTFISHTMTRSDAQQLCNHHDKELAVFNNPSTLSSNDFPAWIGLRRNGNTWEWSMELLEFRRWEQPEPGGNDDCVTITSEGKQMTTRDCSSKLPFVCYNNNLVLVKENKTWEEALEHCRNMKASHIYHQHYRYELVSVQPGEDQSIVMLTMMDSDTEEVWTGLRFMAGHWWWMNTADMLFDMPVCPVKWQHCGALSKNDTVNMKTRDCLEKKNFLCYRL
uniref:C-type lectin domain-containing protein n=1 Tax=Labrus bergylta TaxID=56723 RepID=A0A3Q3GK90_9LABR